GRQEFMIRRVSRAQHARRVRATRAKSLKAGEERMVGWDGIEPPTPGFSARRSLVPITFESTVIPANPAVCRASLTVRRGPLGGMAPDASRLVRGKSVRPPHRTIRRSDGPRVDRRDRPTGPRLSKTGGLA